jgi:hypothetical protein
MTKLKAVPCATGARILRLVIVIFATGAAPREPSGLDSANAIATALEMTGWGVVPAPTALRFLHFGRNDKVERSE